MGGIFLCQSVVLVAVKEWKLELARNNGYEKVNKENLKIIRSKPNIIVSNGDVLHFMTFQFTLIVVILVFGQLFFYLFIINKLTKGWFYYVFKNMKNIQKA
jgi:hypothetical protein